MYFSLNLFALFVWSLASGGLSATPPTLQCTQPTIRKEWRALSKAEQANWISAVKCLANTPALPLTGREFNGGGANGAPAYNSSGSAYDDFVYMHIDQADKVHFTGLFLPWHRWYLQTYENILRERCGLTTPSPYWDWRKDFTNVRTGSLFSDTDPDSGIGGWGKPENDYQITEGGFSRGFSLSYPIHHGLRRNYTATYHNPRTGEDSGDSLLAMITPEAVSAILSQPEGNFTAFQVEMEKGYSAHSGGHFVVGGDLSGKCPAGSPDWCYLGAGNPFWSANEPLFWLHHGMVDRVWWEWQQKSVANKWAFEGGSVKNKTASPTGVAPMLTHDWVMWSSGIGPVTRVQDVLDTMGGFLCYQYE